MKKNVLNPRNYIFVIILGVILSSCSKKDKTASDNLIGTWTAGTSTYTAMVGTRTLLQYFTEVVGLTTDQAQIYVNVANGTIQQSFTGTIQIKADNTYTATLGGSTDTGTWSLSTDGKTLTVVSSSEGPRTFDIIELTSSKLQVQLALTMSIDLNGDSVPETININATVNFSR